MPVFSLLLLLLVAVLSSCATVPASAPEESSVSAVAYDGKARSMYLYSRARLSELEGDYPAALNILRDAIVLDPSSAFLHSSVAEIKLKIGQTQEALEYISKSIKLDPDYRPPYVMAGSLLAAAGKDSEAVVYLRKAMQLNLAKEDAYLQLAISLTRLFEYEEAVSTLKSLVKNNEDSILGYYYLGKTYAQMKLYRDAVGYFSKTLELRPDFDQAAIDKAAAYEAMGDYTKAIETYEGLVGGDDDKTAVQQRLIQLLIQQRRFTDALEYLELAVESGYGGQETLRKIGLVQMELEQFDEAIKVFSSILEKDPANYLIRLYLGIAFEEKNQLDSAYAEFIKIPRDSIPFNEAIGHIAFIQKTQGKPDKAVEVLKAAIADNPRQLELYMNLSSLLESLDKPDEGLALLLDTEKLFEADPRLHFRIGVLYDKLSKRPESIERMKKVISLNPKDAQALNFLGYTYAEMGINLEEALTYLKSAVDIRPNDGFILDSLGWIYFKLKKYDDAATHLEDAVALVGDDSTILEHLGDVYAARKELKKAIKTYKKSLEIDPDRKELIDKIRRLKGESIER